MTDFYSAIRQACGVYLPTLTLSERMAWWESQGLLCPVDRDVIAAAEACPEWRERAEVADDRVAVLTEVLRIIELEHQNIPLAKVIEDFLAMPPTIAVVKDFDYLITQAYR